MLPSQLPQHLFTLTFLSFVALDAASSALAATISDDFSVTYTPVPDVQGD